MIRHLSLLFSFLLASSVLSAQSGLVAAGGQVTGSGGSVSSSVGQVDYITASGSTGTITQGLQQPFEILVVSGIKENWIKLNAAVYPNPTVDYLLLEVEQLNQHELYYKLYDVNGKQYGYSKIASAQTRIDMTQLATASYLLVIYEKEKQIKTFKIIKQH